MAKIITLGDSFDDFPNASSAPVPPQLGEYDDFPSPSSRVVPPQIGDSFDDFPNASSAPVPPQLGDPGEYDDYPNPSGRTWRAPQLGDDGDGDPVRYSPFPVKDKLTPNELGRAYGRLAGLTLAYKLSRGNGYVPEPFRTKMVRAAGLGEAWDDHDLTLRILSAPSDDLGKGGVIGSISHAVSSVASSVTKPLQRITAPVRAAITNITDKVPGLNVAGNLLTGNIATAGKQFEAEAQAMAPMISKIPGVGPALGAALNVVGSLGAQAKDVGSQLTANPMGALATLAGDVVGDVGSVVGGVFQGVAALPGQAYSGIKGVASFGESLAQKFGSGTWAAIEKVNPSLSGELTSIFHGLGGEYASLHSAFDTWSSKLKFAGPGQYTGKIGGNLFTIVKDALGHFTVNKTPAANASDSLTTTIAEGGLVASDPSVMAGPMPAVGAPISIPDLGPLRAGPATNPAGVSLPMGPGDGFSSIPSDPSSMSLIAGQAESSRPAFNMASTNWLAIAAGIGLLGMVLIGGRGNGPLTQAAPLGGMRLKNPGRRRRRSRR